MRGTLGLAGAVACAWLVSCVVAAAAFALPAERHYEMVSPVFKGGFGAAKIEAVSLNGEAVAFFSAGAFAGAPAGFTVLDYLSRRGALGWSTVSQMPPASLLPDRVDVDATPSLDLMLVQGKQGPSYQAANEVPAENLFLHPTELPDITDNWELVGSVAPVNGEVGLAEYKATSASFCNVLLNAAGNEPLVLEAEAEDLRNLELYELNRGCNGEPESLALVGLDNEGKIINSHCDTRAGEGGYGSEGSGIDNFNEVSVDGEEVFFTVCLSGEGLASSSLPHQLFVRLGGSRTLEISRPLMPACVANNVPGEVPCDGAENRASADFAGASEDGSKVYFKTNAPLTEGDEDANNDIYMASIGCPDSKPGCSVAEREVTSLTQVSHDPNPGQAAEVQGVVRVAPDGSRAYYVARGDLLSSDARSSSTTARPPPFAAARTPAVAALALLRSRAAPTTSAPCDASARAVSTPRPADTPVTSTRLPFRFTPSSVSSEVVVAPKIFGAKVCCTAGIQSLLDVSAAQRPILE